MSLIFHKVKSACKHGTCQANDDDAICRDLGQTCLHGHYHDYKKWFIGMEKKISNKKKWMDVNGCMHSRTDGWIDRNIPRQMDGVDELIGRQMDGWMDR